MKKMPQPIPYQGSKRNIANLILQYAPAGIERIIEPFAGSGALSVAAAYRRIAKRFLLNDLNQPLVNLLTLMIECPAEIADQYEQLWLAQNGREREFYDQVRDEFNKTYRPELFLYLLARCVKASVRYNANGDFNQSPDNRRKGRHPASMRSEIMEFSTLLRSRTEITNLDFQATLQFVNPRTDLVYLDPPYQGTSGRRDARYCSGVQFNDMINYLEALNHRDVMFILSYDGFKGDKSYGVELPGDLRLHKMLLNAGRSTQSTLLGYNDMTYESLYLSPTLVTRLNLHYDKPTGRLSTRIIGSPYQLAFDM